MDHVLVVTFDPRTKIFNNFLSAGLLKECE